MNATSSDKCAYYTAPTLVYGQKSHVCHPELELEAAAPGWLPWRLLRQVLDAVAGQASP